jgi:hypothetical protein
LAVRPQAIDLDKGAGQLFLFPGRGRLAGAQADGDVLHANRLAGLESEVADDAVALAEQAEHRDPLSHRRDARKVGRRARHVDGDWLVAILALRGPLAASRQQQRYGEGKAEGATHAYSGFHAS